MLILSLLIIIVIVLLWFMIGRYTEYYGTMKRDFRNLTVSNRRVKWGDVPKPRGKWPTERSRKRKAADEPQALLGGLTLIEARQATLEEDCAIMDKLEIANEQDYQKWYEENKDKRNFETLLTTVSGCVQAGLYAN